MNSTGGCMIEDNLQLLCSAAAEAACTPSYLGKRYELIVRQQPERSRVGSVSEKMDRRPIDPPPIVQLVVHGSLEPFSQAYTVNPAFIMQVVLMDESGKATLRHIKGHRATAMAGSMVSPLHTLRDTSTEQGAYFVFSDLSVRMEGSFRLRFELFEIEGDMVHNRASVISDVFSVYSPKRFPGMMESTRLSKLFAEQGLRIRIRTEAGTKKRGRKQPAISPESAKRAKLSSGYMPGKYSFGTSSTSSESTLTYSMLGNTTAANDTGPFAFHKDPFSAYCNENATAVAASSTNFEKLPVSQSFALNAGSFDYRPAPDTALRSYANTYNTKTHFVDELKAGHGLDLNDIAAVALLDSLSNGGVAKHQILPPISRVGGANNAVSASSHNAMFSLSNSNINIGNEIQYMNIHPQHQQPQHPVYNTAEQSFNNYHISAVNCMPEHGGKGRDQASSILGHGLSFGSAARSYPPLRANGLGLHTPASHFGTSPESYILQAPQRLYTSQTRNTAVNSGIAQQADITNRHAWAADLTGINIELPQAGFSETKSRKDYARTLV